MYIIVGLGNPGLQYDKTRHNVGYMAVTCLADMEGINISGEEHKSVVGKGRIEGEKVILALPLTFMNLSGEAVQKLVHYYKIDPESELIVVYDDIDLPPGKIRIREAGSAGGHNGMKNIIKLLGTDKFTRVRIGVGEKPKGWNLADHVLSRFPKEEESIMDSAVKDACEAIKMIISSDVPSAMNKFN